MSILAKQEPQAKGESKLWEVNLAAHKVPGTPALSVSRPVRRRSLTPKQVSHGCRMADRRIWAACFLFTPSGGSLKTREIPPSSPSLPGGLP